MCLPNPSGDKYWTLFNETKLKALPTQLAISCNCNKNIKLRWRFAVSLWPSSNLGGNCCFSFLFNKWPLHVLVPWALEGLSHSKNKQGSVKFPFGVHTEIAQCLAQAPSSFSPKIIILSPTMIKVWPFAILFWYWCDYLREWRELSLPSVTNFTCEPVISLSRWYSTDAINILQIFLIVSQEVNYYDFFFFFTLLVSKPLRNYFLYNLVLLMVGFAHC